MFLDPQPLRPKQSASPSPFFSARMPEECAGDQRWRLKKRKAVDDLMTPSPREEQQVESANEMDQEDPLESSNATIRLVTDTPTPSPSSHNWKTLSLSSAFDSDFEDVHTAQEIKVQKYDGASSRWSSTGDDVDGAHPPSRASLSGFPASAVSEPLSAPNKAPKVSTPASIALRHASSTRDRAPSTAPWYYRSGSSGNYSTSSTLQEGNASTTSSGRHSWHNRHSQGTTLQGTPTPTEQELRKRIAELADLDFSRQGPAHALETLQESSPERATIRPVPPSTNSSSTGDRQVSGSSTTGSAFSLRRVLTGPRSRSHSASTSDRDAAPAPDIPLRRSSRRWSSPVRVAPLRIRKSKTPPAPSERPSQESLGRSEEGLQDSQASSAHVIRQRESRDSLAQSEATLPLPGLTSQQSTASLLPYRAVFPPSSPIIAVFDSDPSEAPARPENPHLRFSPSVESIQSRLDHPSIIHPPERALRAVSSWSSLRPSSADDIVPPLFIPKKRQGKRPASLPLGSTSNFASSSKMDEEIDTLPYPRQPFSSHLSTIASESDRFSEATNQRLSHFSLGSGVMTGDDGSTSSSLLLNGRWAQPSARENDSAQKIDSEEEEPRTSNIYREGSAIPQPLFKAKTAPGGGRTYDGCVPPVPPIPRSGDSEEDFDTVSELPPQSPALRPKRSGYSLRRRSNSTPSRTSQSQGMSYIESERASQASSLFPTWAKHFYSGTGHLISSSGVSLSSSRSQRRPHRQYHVRTESQWTERSITSRLGTGYDEIESSLGSPNSSHFLPSIFRPRTRPRARSEGNSGSSKIKSRPSRRSRPSADIASQRDSMAITPAPADDQMSAEVLPSGQPRWGRLKDSSPTPDQSPPAARTRPLPREYSRQKDWDHLEFPRPMTKDRLSDFDLGQPHLLPTRRTATHRLSNWRPPSFVESLDTLVRSRCNRQILLFCLGFICPILWMIAACLPLPHRPASQGDMEKTLAGSAEDIAAAMMKHEAGDAERRWREEKQWLKARWWRTLNRIMSVIGVLVIAAVVSLSVVVARGVGGSAAAT
ncbi:serine-rich protein [Teratosphaeria destructans]|uniref:Serine-rich protein n=1 Tax=Teratosphaeria destructans TaxID=418781 RepID=A0A9W7W1A3_9PEZI|nr:serine-rich protein [Teratosphaeria destructans]